MAGQEQLWLELAVSPLAAMPTNPSSFVLALVGIVSWLSYEMHVRPGHEHRPRQPQTASASLKPHYRKKRRIQPRRRVA